MFFFFFFSSTACRQEDHVTYFIPYGIKAQPRQQRPVGQGNLLGTIFVPLPALWMS